MPFNAAAFDDFIRVARAGQMDLPSLEKAAAASSTPPGLRVFDRPSITPLKELEDQPIEKLVLSPLLSPNAYRDVTLSPYARKNMYQSAKQIMRLRARLESRGLPVPDELDRRDFPSFMEALENIQRPQSAIFNAVVGVRQGLSPLEVVKNVVQGFTFEERAYFSDVLVAFGSNPEHWATKVLGFAGDITLDPINLVPGYVFYAPLKLAGKTAMRARVIREILEEAGQTRIVSTLRRAFISSSGNKLLDEIKRSGATYRWIQQSEILEKWGVFENKWQPVLGEAYDEVSWYAQHPEKISNARVRAGGKFVSGADNNAFRADLQNAVNDYNSIKRTLENIKELSDVDMPDVQDELYHALLSMSKKGQREQMKLRRRMEKVLSKRRNAILTDVRQIYDTVPKQIGREFLQAIRDEVPMRRAKPGEVPDVHAVKGKSPGWILNTDKLNKRGVDLVMARAEPILRKIGTQLTERNRLRRFVTKEDVRFVNPKKVKGAYEEAVGLGERVLKGLPTKKDIVPGKFVKQLRQALEDYAAGKIDETALEDFLNLYIGPGAIREVRHLSEVTSLLKSRRDALLQMTELRDIGTELVPMINEALIKNTYSQDEMIDMLGETGRRLGLVRHIRDVGKRMDKVREYLSPVSGSLVEGGVILDELPDVVRKVMEDFIAGSVTKAEALEIIGKPGEKTLRAALNRITTRMTAAERLETLTRPRATDRLRNILWRRYGSRIQELEDMLEVVEPWIGQVTTPRALRALAQNPDILDKLGDDTISKLVFRRYINQRRALDFKDLKRIAESGTDALDDLGNRMFSRRGFWNVIRDTPQEAAKLLDVTPRALMETEAQDVARTVSRARYLDEVSRLWGVRLKGTKPLIEGVREQRLDRLKKVEIELNHAQVRDKALMAEKPVDYAEIAARVRQRERRIEKLRADIRARGEIAVEGGKPPTIGTEDIQRVSPHGPYVDAVPEGYVESTLDRLKGVYFPRDIAPEIERVLSNAFSDEASNAVKRAFDAMQDYWKIWTLGVFPAYHTRNFFGNLWLMHLGGMFKQGNMPRSISNMIRAGQLQRWAASDNFERLRQITKEIHGVGEVDGVKLMDIAKRNGIINEGFFAVEADPRRALRIEERFSKSVLGTQGPIASKGIAAGRAIENQARLGLFMHYLDDGMSIREAAQQTKKFLFDYSDITKFERDWMRTFFPFYVWSRKNVPLEIEQAIKQPHVFGRIPKTTRAASQLAGFKEEEMPPKTAVPKWIRESSPFPVKRTEEGKLQFLVLRNWLPAVDIDEFLGAERMARTVFSMTTPFLTVPAETMLKKNMYFDSDLVGPQEFLGLRLDKRTVNALRTVRLLNFLDQLDPFELFRTERGAPGKLERVSAALTGLKPAVASPEREVLSRTVRRRDQLQQEWGRIRSLELRKRLGL